MRGTFNAALASLTLASLALVACSADNTSPTPEADALPVWVLEDATFFPASRSLTHAEDGVVLPDGTLLVGDAEHGLVTLSADGTKAAFGDFATRPELGWSSLNGISFEPDGIHVLVADIAEGKIFRVSTQSGEVTLVFDNPYGVNTAVSDSTGAIWFTQSTQNPPGAQSEQRMYAAAGQPMGDGAVFRLAPGSQTPEKVADGFDFSNGIAIDEARGQIYVAETLAGRVHVIPVNFASGEIGADKSYFEVFSPDNIELDADGNLWVASPISNEVLIVDPDSGGMHSAFSPTPGASGLIVEETRRRLADGEEILSLLGPDTFGPMPGMLTGVILSPANGPVYISGLGDALVRLDR